MIENLDKIWYIWDNTVVWNFVDTFRSLNNNKKSEEIWKRTVYPREKDVRHEHLPHQAQEHWLPSFGQAHNRLDGCVCHLEGLEHSRRLVGMSLVWCRGLGWRAESLLHWGMVNSPTDQRSQLTKVPPCTEMNGFTSLKNNHVPVKLFS